jgi:hypothetical protein
MHSGLLGKFKVAANSSWYAGGMTMTQALDICRLRRTDFVNGFMHVGSPVRCAILGTPE